MCFKRCGRVPRPFRQSATCASLMGLLAVLAGCASDRGATHSSDSTTAPMHMAGVRPQIEADGLPAQLAPRNPTPIADDPREPWSPNYGSVRPTRTGALGNDTVAIVVAAPSPPRAITVAHAQPIDAEDIIRRAVAAHEMRQEN
jgi:hypothetical protein